MKTIRKIITLTFIIMTTLAITNITNIQAKNNIKKYLKVYNYDTDKVIHYIEGQSDCDDISDIYFKTNYKIKKIRWDSNDNIAQCWFTSNQKQITIKYHNEGQTVITLTIKDNKNKKHKYKIFASSYTPYDRTKVMISKKNTIIRRGATVKKFGVSSVIKKVKQKKVAKIYGECKDYYYAKIGKTKGFISKKSIIPHVNIDAIPINGKIKLNIKNWTKNTILYRTTNEKETNLKKCIKIKTSSAQYIDSNVKSGVRYFYKYKYNNKVYNGASAYTNTINGNDNIKYFKSLKYSNLYIQGQDDKAFKNNWQNYIRFYLTNKGTTLEAHVNIKYFFGTDEFSRTIGPDSIKSVLNNYFYSGVDGDSFLDVFEQGIRRSYNIFIPGSKNDFNNHSFNFVIKIHEYDYMNYRDPNEVDDGVITCPPDEFPGGAEDNSNIVIEKPLTYSIYLAHNNDCIIKEGNSEYFWSFAVANNDDRYLKIAGSYELAANEYEKGDNIPQEFKITKEVYRNTCAHEFGHLLGLSDAYYNNNGDNMCENEETCRIEYNEGKKLYTNLMKECDGRATPNDIEMVLYANRNANNNLEWQDYKTNKSNKISKMIHNTTDKYKQ